MGVQPFELSLEDFIDSQVAAGASRDEMISALELKLAALREEEEADEE